MVWAFVLGVGNHDHDIPNIYPQIDRQCIRGWNTMGDSLRDRISKRLTGISLQIEIVLIVGILIHQSMKILIHLGYAHPIRVFTPPFA